MCLQSFKLVMHDSCFPGVVYVLEVFGMAAHHFSYGSDSRFYSRILLLFSFVAGCSEDIYTSQMVPNLHVPSSYSRLQRGKTLLILNFLMTVVKLLNSKICFC